MRVTTDNLKERIARAKKGYDFSCQVQQKVQFIIHDQNISRRGLIVEYKTSAFGYYINNTKFLISEKLFQSVKQQLTSLGYTVKPTY